MDDSRRPTPWRLIGGLLLLFVAMPALFWITVMNVVPHPERSGVYPDGCNSSVWEARRPQDRF